MHKTSALNACCLTSALPLLLLLLLLLLQLLFLLLAALLLLLRLLVPLLLQLLTALLLRGLSCSAVFLLFTQRLHLTDLALFSPFGTLTLDPRLL